jgi:hypothetical protein
MITVAPTVPSHFKALCDDIRTEDRIESLMFTMQPLKQALTKAVSVSSQCFTVLVDGEPAVIFGVAPMPGNPLAGSVWLRAANRISKCLLYVIKESPRYLQGFLKAYPAGLYALPMAENNDLHLRWLRLVGFTPHHWIYHNNTPFQVMTYV